MMNHKSCQEKFNQYCHDLEKNGLLYLNVKVIPRAPRTELVEVMVGHEGEEVLKIKVAAVPEKGKANKELCAYVAKQFGLSKSQVVVSQGKSCQRKVLKVCANLLNKT